MPRRSSCHSSDRDDRSNWQTGKAVGQAACVFHNLGGQAVTPAPRPEVPPSRPPITGRTSEPALRVAALAEGASPSKADCQFAAGDPSAWPIGKCLECNRKVPGRPSAGNPNSSVRKLKMRHLMDAPRMLPGCWHFQLADSRKHRRQSRATQSSASCMATCIRRSTSRRHASRFSRSASGATESVAGTTQAAFE